jgi:hypothetical protein
MTNGGYASMENKKINLMRIKIAGIKAKIMKLGDIRPGSLNQQFKDRKEKTGAYWQLNYTHKMKTYTEYVRPGVLPEIEKETSEYKIFKKLLEQWIDLSIKLSKLKVAEMKKNS